ncbi:hypothetical protein [Motiliproteus sp. MSK22-1]|uniref:hypothetical protein n=1 Tax=Motiliproteus sp. MSK22-1 TaxID=1897630 RepID=UPI000976E5F6|nr:hypothetical protein [Motiliproteus sp. MSK22-1]OMH39358.1 hypothetical protein BGP75_03325 [Motiliproteus sp. MSK22-1]
MTSKKKQLLLLVIPILLLAFYQSQKTGDVVMQLQAEGFVVDHRIDSVPPLLIDQNNRQLALVYSDRFVKIRFDQVIAVEERQLVQGDGEESLALRLKLKNHVLPSITIKANRVSDAVVWRRQLQGWLFQ